jgi:hypothetical protein
MARLLLIAKAMRLLATALALGSAFLLTLASAPAHSQIPTAAPAATGGAIQPQSQAADAGAERQVLPTEDGPAPAERPRWYGLQTITVDTAALMVILVSAADKSLGGPALAAGMGTYLRGQGCWQVASRLGSERRVCPDPLANDPKRAIVPSQLPPLPTHTSPTRRSRIPRHRSKTMRTSAADCGS